MEILSDYAEGLINKFINENIQSKVIITKLFQLFKSLDDNFKYRSELVHESLKLFQQNVIILILLQVLIPIKGEIFNALNVIVYKDRIGENVDRTLIKKTIKILEDLDIQSTGRVGESTKNGLKKWISTLLTATNDYITKKSKREITSLSAIEYVRSSLKYIKEEKERFNDYSMNDYLKEIYSINFKYLIEENAQ